MSTHTTSSMLIEHIFRDWTSDMDDDDCLSLASEDLMEATTPSTPELVTAASEDAEEKKALVSLSDEESSQDLTPSEDATIEFPCATVACPKEVTPKALEYLKQRYNEFIPQSLPAPRRRKKPVCLFVNFMGTRKRELPVIQREKPAFQACPMPTDAPTGLMATSSLHGPPSKKMKVGPPTDGLDFF